MFVFAGSIGGDGQVEFPLDVHGRGHEQSIDLEPLGPGLVRDHPVGQHEGGRFAHRIDRIDDLDEACLAATTGVDLGLDDHESGPIGHDGFSGLDGRVDRGAHAAGGHGDARGCEQFTGLVFVDLHRCGTPVRV